MSLSFLISKGGTVFPRFFATVDRAAEIHNFFSHSRDFSSVEQAPRMIVLKALIFLEVMSVSFGKVPDSDEMPWFVTWNTNLKEKA